MRFVVDLSLVIEENEYHENDKRENEKNHKHLLCDDMFYALTLEKVSHKHPMISLDKAFDLHDLHRFFEGVGKVDLIMEPKIDGLAVSLSCMSRGNWLLLPPGEMAK